MVATLKANTITRNLAAVMMVALFLREMFRTGEAPKISNDGSCHGG
jgi:hypothetical protein